MACYSSYSACCILPERTGITVAPAETAITTAFARAQLGMDAADTSLDALLSVYIPAATKMAQDYTGITFVTTTYKAYWNALFGCLKIQNSPNFAITEFAYVDTDGNGQTLTSDDYRIYTDDVFAYIFPAEGESFPDTDEVPNAVTITYTAGYGNQAAVPTDIQLAIAMMVTGMVANRGDCSDECGEVPCGAQRILTKYKPAIIRRGRC